MKTTLFANRIVVTFEFTGEGNLLVEKSNAIYNLISKYNAQNGLYANKSPWKTNNKGVIVGTQIGSTGGSITFHSHSCNHQEAAKELVALLESFGLILNEQLHEVVKTHKADGTAYKRPQYFIEAI